MRGFIKIVTISTAIYFLSWIFVYSTGVNHLAIQSEDTLPTIFLPVTIIKNGTLYADDYYEMIRDRYPHPDDKDFQIGLTPFYFQKVDGHYISAFPLTTGLLAILVYLFPLIMGMAISWENLIFLSHLVSSLIVALSGGVLYLLLKNYLLKDKKSSLLLTAVYLFGTINYALVSQALWQHGTLQLFLLLSLLFTYQRRWIFSGLSLGLAVLSRPTAILMMPFLLLILLNTLFNSKINIKDVKLDRKKLIALLVFFLGIVIAGVLFLWYTQKYYLGIQNNGYADQFLVGWLSRFPEGFLGLWLSPSKGILVFSPIFIFSILGLITILRNGRWKQKENLIYLASAAIIIVHTMILGRWKHWYGGWSFGYRMASDIIPFLVILLVPLIKSSRFIRYKKIFLVLFVISVLIEIYGMVFFDGIWHAAYDKGFVDTAWLWSIKDSEFIFNIRRVLVKINVLGKACPKC